MNRIFSSLFSAFNITLLSATLLLTSCGSPKDVSKENFSKVISQNITNKATCTVRLTVPYEDIFYSEADLKSLKRAEAAPPIIDMLNFFVDLGYLKVTEKQEKRSVGYFQTVLAPVFIRQYNLTEIGKQNFGLDMNLAFCPVKGHELTKVVKFDEPVERDGMKVVNVEINYKDTGVAEWTKKPEFIKLFPNESRMINIKEKRGDAVLKLTSEGWEVVSTYLN